MKPSFGSNTVSVFLGNGDGSFQGRTWYPECHLANGATGAMLVDEAWVFPFRVGSHTRYMQPDQFASLENVSARRAAALLLWIPDDHRIRIELRWMRPTGNQSFTAYDPHEMSGQLVEVSLDQNVALFRVSSDQQIGYHELRLPLDWIDTVWRDDQISAWVVSSSAVIERRGGKYTALKATS